MEWGEQGFCPHMELMAGTCMPRWKNLVLWIFSLKLHFNVFKDKFFSRKFLLYHEYFDHIFILPQVYLFVLFAVVLSSACWWSILMSWNRRLSLPRIIIIVTYFVTFSRYIFPKELILLRNVVRFQISSICIYLILLVLLCFAWYQR